MTGVDCGGTAAVGRNDETAVVSRDGGTAGQDCGETAELDNDGEVRGRRENGRTGDDGRTGDNNKTDDHSRAADKGPGFSTNVKPFNEKTLRNSTSSVSAMILNLIKFSSVDDDGPFRI